MVWLHDRKQDLGLTLRRRAVWRGLGCAIDGVSGESQIKLMHGQIDQWKVFVVSCAMILKDVWSVVFGSRRDHSTIQLPSHRDDLAPATHNSTQQFPPCNTAANPTQAQAARSANLPSSHQTHHERSQEIRSMQCKPTCTAPTQHLSSLCRHVTLAQHVLSASCNGRAFYQWLGAVRSPMMLTPRRGQAMDMFCSSSDGSSGLRTCR